MAWSPGPCEDSPGLSWLVVSPFISAVALFIFFYLLVCVCVCVCVRKRERGNRNIGLLVNPRMHSLV